MVKKKKVSKPKIVKPETKKLKDFNVWGEADKIEKEVLDKGKVKINKELKKVW